MRTEYGKTLVELGYQDPNVVVLGADTTDSLKTASFGKEFPERFFNVGIAEANLVSVSAGLAISGKTAFASTYAIFVPGRAVDQIRNAIAYPSRNGKQGLNVKLVVSHGGLSVGADGGSHQQIEDIAIMRAIPNMRVLIPADSTAVSHLTRRIAENYGPFYMRMARSKTPVVHSESQEFEIGKGITLRDGSDCTIASCGITVQLALEAAEKLSQEGISCRVLDMFSIKPIDSDILEKAARETGSFVTCEEHNILGGMGSAVAEVVSERYPVPIHRIGVQDMFGESARDNEISLLLERHGITSINIVDHVKQVRGKN
ncbi:MAG: transketolase family protein [Nitrosopumilaceae archaeon]|nr:transketolase family protein [Nitrosopumilaceae archaeon]NIU00482.1 transketolase family protein [Nitrosopumilaceae archaeon]NIU86865.1 transketolase family protein [Nitrosopumilaceae archaeon]NIV65545.1 transketolase family protein [Nitrosopumilaceae archaeon]NIX61084.1 transketolase family protein [Nitrosopumilaceae archaeon]